MTDPSNDTALYAAKVEELHQIISGLKPKQAIFVRRYIGHGNAYRAMREAGYDKLDKSNAHYIRHNEQVSKAISLALEIAAHSIMSDAVLALEKLHAAAFTDIGDIIEVVTEKDEEGKTVSQTLRIRDNIPPEAMASVGKIGQTVGGTFSVTMRDNSKAIRELLEIYGLAKQNQRRIQPVAVMVYASDPPGDHDDSEGDDD